jgi:hypothetical protein
MNSINAAITTACGGGSGGGVLSGDGGTVPPPATGCNVSFVVVDSMGPTQAEMQGWGCTQDQIAVAPTMRPTPGWTTTADCRATPDAGDTADQVACMLAKSNGSFSFPIQVAQLVACAAYQRGASLGGGGTLSRDMNTQAAAYWAYRDAVAALAATGNAMVAQAKAADDDSNTAQLAVAQAQAAAVLDQINRGNAVAQARDNLNAAAITYQDKVLAYDDLMQITPQQVMTSMYTYGQMGSAFFGGGASLGGGSGNGSGGDSSGGNGGGTGGAIAGAASCAAAGAAAGSVVPGIGTAIGAGIGAAVGLYLALQGPSEAQKDAAKSAENEAQAAVQTAQDALQGAIAAQEAGAADEALTLAVAGAQAVAAYAKAAASMGQGQANFSSQLATIFGHLQALSASSVAIQSDVTTTELDVATAQATYQQATISANVDFGIMATFDSNVVGPLQAEIEWGRQTLVQARNVFAFIYPDDYSSMTAGSVVGRWEGQNGANAGPNAWIDQIYDYDLAPLRVVYGQSVAPDGVFQPDKLQRYFNNLVQLAGDGTGQGDYQNAYHAIPPQAGSALVTAWIAGPALQDIVLDDAGVQQAVADPLAANWLVLCSAGNGCVPGGGPGYCSPYLDGGADAGASAIPSFNQVCAPPLPPDAGPDASVVAGPNSGGVVVAAITHFSLDRWGYVYGTPPVVGDHVMQQPTSSDEMNLNGRWNRFAVNVMGPQGSPVIACQTNDHQCNNGMAEIDFDLLQLGPYVTTGLDYRMHLLPTFQTTVPDSQNVFLPPSFAAGALGGKGLDNASQCRGTTFGVMSGDDGCKFSLTPNSDLAGLPLAGDYALRILPAAGAAQDLGRMEWIQLMIEPLWFKSSN